MSKINEFNTFYSNTNNSYKGNPLRSGNMTKRFKKHLKTIQDKEPVMSNIFHQNNLEMSAQLPPDTLYNTDTQRFVNADVYTDRRVKSNYRLKQKYINRGYGMVGKTITQAPKRFYDKLDQFYIKNINEVKVNTSVFAQSSTEEHKETLKRFLLSLNPNAGIVIKVPTQEQDFDDQGNYGTVMNYYALNDMTLNDLINALSDDVEFGGTGSDGATAEYLIANRIIRIGRVGAGKKKAGGAFFKYLISKPFEGLEGYGLFPSIKPENYDDNCLVLALKQAGVSNDILANIRTLVKNRNIPMCKIGDIANKHNLHISVRKVEDNKNRIHYGNKELEEIKIGLIDEHFFLIEEVNYTKFSIENFDIAYKSNPAKFNLQRKRGNGCETTKSNKINSFQLIKLLLENKEYFIKNNILTEIKNCNELYATQFYDKIKDFASLEVMKGDVRLVVDKSPEGLEAKREKQETKDYWNSITERVFFDFETTTDGDKHIPYLCYFYIEKSGETCGFIGEDCGKQMLNKLKSIYDNEYYRPSYKKNGKPVMLYDADTDKKIQEVKIQNYCVNLIAHNSGYDFRFIFKYLECVSTIEKGTSLMSGSGQFYGMKVSIRDSYAMITAPLRNFGKMFKLSQEKEVMPYSLYTNENVYMRYVPLDYCLEFVKEKDKKVYLENIKKWNCLVCGNLVDIITYSAEYCKMDCVVLAQGWAKFGKLLYDFSGLDVNNYISIASLADGYLIEKGCYDETTELSGVVRAFIQRCLVGGRTMCSQNKKWNKKNVRMNDFDAVSLYPSAMKRMKGFLRGSPKVIEPDNLTDDFLNKQSGYFVKIKVNSIPIKRHFPLLSKKDKNGIRQFSNDLSGEEIYIDDIALQDAVKFQGITYDIIEGYYFNEGFNTKINTTIEYLFNQRLKAKKEGNPVQNIIKLLMNSSYGKTALKEIVDDVKYVKSDRFDDFLTRNYNTFKEAIPSECKRFFRVKQIKPINEHFNRVHIGVHILSTSKTIMNEVMCCAEDNKLSMFYQDTDSIHILDKDIKVLQQKYNEKYGRELIGKGMGQFHSDFELEGAKNVYSENFIALGKKCYIDALVGEDEEGNEVRGHHIRLKGVPTGSIINYCNERKITPLTLFQQLYDGQSVTFNLLLDAKGEEKVRFKYNKDMTVSSVRKFTRCITFK